MSNTLDLSDFYKVEDIKWHIGSGSEPQEMELVFNNGKFDLFKYYSVFVNGTTWIPFQSYGRNYLRTNLIWFGNELIGINKNDYVYIPRFTRSSESIKELAWNTLANLSEEDVAYVPVLTNIVNS